MPDEATDVFTPPYISFAQLENVLERMRNEGVPARVDRSYLGSWSGSAQGQFLKAARSLDLLDEHGRPTDTLKQIAADKNSRKKIIGDLVRAKYPEAVALGQDATQQQLDDVFREYPGISGSTTRKAITFYLHAAKFADIPLSPFFKVGKATGGGGGGGGGARRGRGAGKKTLPEPEPTITPPDPLGGLHPAITTLVQSLPTFSDNGSKPEFSEAEREAWFAYAKATFNLIYAPSEKEQG